MKIAKKKLVLVKEKQYEYEKKIGTTIELVEFVKNVLKIQNEAQEVTYLLMLNKSNYVTSFSELGRGGNDWCNISISQLFRTILLSNTNKFILIHNHPSGDATPSLKDLEVTKHIFNSANILNLQFLDHLIIGDDEYKSCMNCSINMEV